MTYRQMVHLDAFIVLITTHDRIEFKRAYSVATDFKNVKGAGTWCYLSEDYQRAANAEKQKVSGAKERQGERMKWWEYLMLWAVVTLNLGTLGVYMKIAEDTGKRVAEHEERLEQYRSECEERLSAAEKKLDDSVRHCDYVVDAVIHGMW